MFNVLEVLMMRMISSKSDMVCDFDLKDDGTHKD